MIINRNQILGLILAGGQSRRMAYQNKWQFPLGEKTILDHVIQRFSPQVGQIIINGNSQNLSAYPFAVIDDYIPNHQGPLVGILSGLLYAKEHGYGWLATAPCDTPFLPTNYIAQLAHSIEDSLSGTHRAESTPTAAVVKHQQYIQGVFGLWSTSLITPLLELLNTTSTRALKTWIQQLSELSPSQCLLVNVADDDSYAFFNINTPEDLEKAKQLHSQAR